MKTLCATVAEIVCSKSPARHQAPAAAPRMYGSSTSPGLLAAPDVGGGLWEVADDGDHLRARFRDHRIRVVKNARQLRPVGEVSGVQGDGLFRDAVPRQGVGVELEEFFGRLVPEVRGGPVRVSRGGRTAILRSAKARRKGRGRSETRLQSRPIGRPRFFFSTVRVRREGRCPPVCWEPESA